jgi:hypothetical protein
LRLAGGEPLRPSNSVRLFTLAVHPPVRPWSPRSQGFPREADRPRAVAALTKIFHAEIERLLLAASGFNPAANTPASARPRLGGISFLHRFGSALNHHVHLHACVTDGVFVPPAAEAGWHAPPAFLPVRLITAADLAALTKRVRRRVIRRFRRSRLLNAAAAADMLAWENSGFSVDASVRITLIDRDVPSYFQSLEHLLRYCARPPIALERLSVIGITEYSRRTTSSGGQSRRWRLATLARNARPRPAGMETTVTAPEAAATRIKSPARMTPRGLPGRN